MSTLPPFSRNCLPDPKFWQEYRKKIPVRATRIIGPFEVITREGRMSCEDGWLAIDSRGWPYPIAADEFDRAYEPVAQ